jgi:hypothetical protein
MIGSSESRRLAVVNAAFAEAARKQAAQAAQQKQTKPAAAPEAAAKPEKLTLADLGAAWRARRAAKEATGGR